MSSRTKMSLVLTITLLAVGVLSLPCLIWALLDRDQQIAAQEQQLLELLEENKALQKLLANMEDAARVERLLRVLKQRIGDISQSHRNVDVERLQQNQKDVTRETERFVDLLNGEKNPSADAPGSARKLFREEEMTTPEPAPREPARGASRQE